MNRGDREKPAPRRGSTSYTLSVQSERMGRQKAHVTFGRYDDGRLCEVFVSVARVGSDMRTAFEVWAMTASKALQSGQSAVGLSKSIRYVRDDYAGLVTSPPAIEGKTAGSLWDALGMLLEEEG